MIKSSIKSTEGQTMVATIIGGGYLLYSMLTGSEGTQIDLAPIAEQAVALNDVLTTTDWTEMGTVGIVVTFIYKMYSKFTDGRITLKTKELTG